MKKFEFRAISPVTFKTNSPTPTDPVTSRETSRPVSTFSNLPLVLENYKSNNVTPLMPIYNSEYKDMWDLQNCPSSSYSSLSSTLCSAASGSTGGVWKSVSSRRVLPQPRDAINCDDEKCYSYDSKNDGMGEQRLPDEVYSSNLEDINYYLSFFGKKNAQRRLSNKSTYSDLTLQYDHCNETVISDLSDEEEHHEELIFPFES